MGPFPRHDCNRSCIRFALRRQASGKRRRSSPQHHTAAAERSEVGDQTSRLPQVIGLESLIPLFACGLVFAVLAYIMLSVARDNLMSAIVFSSKQYWDDSASYMAILSGAISAGLLLVGIV